MSTLRFLVNPASGRGAGEKRLPLLRKLAAQAGAGFVASKSSHDLVEQARRAVADGVERLVVVGGDGTQHLAVQALATTGTALGVVPIGSGNDLAANLGVPRELEAAVHHAVTGPVTSVDVGRIDVGDGKPPIYFGGYCGIGFDSEVTRVANQVRVVRGPLIYPWAVLKTLVLFRAPSIRAEHDGGVLEGRAMFVTAANVTSFGGGMKIAPHARMDDGLFDLVFVRRVGKIRLLTIFPKVYSGRHLDNPEVTVVRTRRVALSLDRPMELYGDGEPLLPLAAGETLVAEIIPKGLRVVAQPPSPTPL